MARILGKVKEEVIRDVTKYLRHIQGLLPRVLEAANCEAVQQWMDRAAGAEAVVAYGPSTTRQVAMGPPALAGPSGPQDGTACKAADSTEYGSAAGLRKHCRQSYWNPRDRSERCSANPGEDGR